MCIALQKKDREIALHGYESGRIVRLPGGEYIEVHQPVDDYDRYKLVDIEHYETLIVRPNEKGRIPWHELRGSSSPHPECLGLFLVEGHGRLGAGDLEEQPVLAP